MGVIFNLNREGNSLQVSRLVNIPEGNFEIRKGEDPVLIKNVTENPIKLQVKLSKNVDYVETLIYPGWNPELVIGIKGVPSNSLQYGN